jgi:hypothetical protein
VYEHEIKASERALSEDERAESLYAHERNMAAIDEYRRLDPLGDL